MSNAQERTVRHSKATSNIVANNKAAKSVTKNTKKISAKATTASTASKPGGAKGETKTSANRNVRSVTANAKQNTNIKSSAAPKVESQQEGFVPDPYKDLEGWGRFTLSGLRTQTLRSILLLREEAEKEKDSAGGASGDEVDMSAARDEKQSRILLLSALQDRLSEIDAAIRRLEAGDYGICEETGEEIPIPRLVANPLARSTIEAQQRRERMNKLFANHLGRV
jgi:DnaK suppressor protein